MRKVIVTGANGFIGTALLKEMIKDGIKIIAVIRNKDSYIDDIKDLSGVSIVYCELSEIARLSSLIMDRDIDACIHLAWDGSFGDSRADYALQLENIKYSLDLLQALKEMNISRFVGAGTLAEKDVLNYHPRDGATPNAVSIYGVAKSAAHFMTKAECTRLDIEHIWCYLSNTYGVGNKTGNFVNFASELMLEGRHAAFTAGEQMYDFVYITDTARSLYAAAGRGGKNTAYYLGSTRQRPLKEFIRIIRDTINPDIQLYLGEVPFNGIALAPEEFDCAKLVRDTGYEPSIDFEEGIKLTIDWLKDK